MKKSIRFHHLDALRAIMMILGIVIHAALSYCLYDHKLVWVVSDEFSEHIGFDALADFIHLFRMQIFFIVSGFFAAMLFFERGAKAMLINRIRRILLPLIIAFIIIIPISIAAFIFSINNIETALGNSDFITFNLQTILQNDYLSLIHLWFLYYLMLFCLIAFFMSLFLIKNYPLAINQIREKFKTLFLSNQILFINISMTYFALVAAKKTVMEASMSFIPDLLTFSTYSIFFTFGWFLYHQRANLNHFKKNYFRFLLIGIVLCLVRWTIASTFENTQNSLLIQFKMLLSATIIWHLTYGIIGLFIEKFEKQSKSMRYLSDAAYWIYLTHLPLTAFLPGLIVSWNIPVILKFSIVVLTTFAFTLTTYHLFVRSTFIGQFLNGKRYSNYKGV